MSDSDPYRLGIDLGTTFTAAAVARAARVEPVVLGGSHGTAVPSVVHLGGDRMLVGVDADRRSATEPGLVVREFKRRVGDPTPFVVGGRPVTADALMGRLVSWVVGQVSATEGGPPQALAVTHPANWGEHKRELLRQAIGREGVRLDRLVPEPVAAAHYYAAQRRLASGSVVAVYDLGGGTFDAAVVEVEDEGARCTIRGRPDGIERLGGIDFDEAVFGHVLRTLGLDPDDLDPDPDPGDPALVTAVARLRRSCVEAKEALSDTDEVAIAVMLPGRHTQVRLARAELEDMVRPALDETIVALRRAVDSAGVTVDDLTAVLLVGGSSRMPLVEQKVTSGLGQPVATDARPKDAISMGAAFVAAQLEPPAAAPAPPPPPAPPAEPVPAEPVAAPGAVSAPWPSNAPRKRRRSVLALVGLVLVVGAVAAGVALAARGGGGSDRAAPTPAAGEPADPAADDPAAVTPEVPSTTSTTADRAIAGAYDLSGLAVDIGWLDTDDQFILANVAAVALEEAGATVDGDGPTLAVGAEALRDQLVDGEVDLYWDYLGRPAGIDDVDVPLGVPAPGLQDRLNEVDAVNGLVWLEPAGFSLENGVAMRRREADELGISSIADVERLLDQDPEAVSLCFDLEDRMRGLEAAYGFRFSRPVFVPLPQDIYPRLAAGDCTFGDVFSPIDPAMADLDLVVLDDNRSHYTPMNPAPRLRADLLREHPEIEELLAPIAQALDDRTMAELMARVVVDGEIAADVALDWLQDEGFVGR